MKDVTEEDVERVARTFFDFIAWNSTRHDHGTIPDPGEWDGFNRGAFLFTARKALGLETTSKRTEPSRPPADTLEEEIRLMRAAGLEPDIPFLEQFYAWREGNADAA